jgi:hypothetical protein
MLEVKDQIAMLKARSLGAISVGGHDCSDEVIELFADEFAYAYRYIRVGEPITLGAMPPPEY